MGKQRRHRDSILALRSQAQKGKTSFQNILRRWKEKTELPNVIGSVNIVPV